MATEKLTPPGIELSPLPVPSAPVSNGRGSLIPQDQIERVWTSAPSEIPDQVIIPLDDRGRRMAPLDKATGRPLPMVVDSRNNLNRHHAFYYRRYYVHGTPGQLAARHCSIQRVNRLKHNNFHREFEGGTAFPANTTEEFNQTIWGWAGYIVPFGVDFKNGEAQIIELSERQKEMLSRPGIFTTEKGSIAKSRVGDFLMDYAISRDFSPVEEILIEEFLSIDEVRAASNESLKERKLALAMRLTNLALGMAVDPIRPRFAEAKRTHHLSKNKSQSRDAWVAAKKIISGREPHHFRKLEQNLAHQFLGAAATA